MKTIDDLVGTACKASKLIYSKTDNSAEVLCVVTLLRYTLDAVIDRDMQDSEHKKREVKP